MIAELFAPLDIECLVNTAVELWETGSPRDLSERQQEVLNRARAAVHAEMADRASPYPPVTALIPKTQENTLWVLRHWDRHDDQVTFWADEESAYGALAEHVRERWSNVRDIDGVPDAAPAEDREAVRAYYGAGRDDDGYSIYPDTVGRRQRDVRTADA